MKLTKDKLHITGMHCSGCAERISNVLTDLEGVRSADVSWEKEQAHVAYDSDQTGFSTMKEAVEKAGYKAEKQ